MGQHGLIRDAACHPHGLGAHPVQHRADRVNDGDFLLVKPDRAVVDAPLRIRFEPRGRRASGAFGVPAHQETGARIEVDG